MNPTPEEIDIISQAVKSALEESGSGGMSIFQMAMSAFIMIVSMSARSIMKSFKNQISKIVATQLESINKIISDERKEREDMFTMLHMHIEQLRHVQERQDNLEETQIDHGKKIKELENMNSN